MSDRRIAPRSLNSAEIAALLLSLAAIVGNLVIAWLVPAPPPDLALCLVWIITLTIALHLNIAVDTVEINFVAFFVLSAFMLFGSGAALAIFVSSLFLSEIANQIRSRLRADTPREWRSASLSICYNLAVDGLGLFVGGILYYLLGGTTPLLPPSAEWLAGLTPSLVLAMVALETAHFFTSFGVGAWILRLQHIAISSFINKHWLEITILGAIPTFSSFALAIAALNMPLPIFAGACALLLSSIAIAHNLGRARVRLERRVSELHSLTAIGQIVANSLELPEVLQAIHQQTQRLMDARNFYIALYDENERRITFPLAYEHNEPVTYTSRLFGEGFTEYIILSRQPLLIKNNVQEFARQIGQPAADPQVRSWLGVPIAVGDRVLGVIAMQSRERANSYDESHRDILISIAAQAATAIRNSQLYMSLRHQTSNLFVMNSVLTAINATLNLDEVLNIIVTSLPHVMGCQKAAILLADDEGRTASLAAAYNLSTAFMDEARSIPISPNGRSAVVATGQPLIIPDVTQQNSPTLILLKSEMEGFRALAEVPLWAQDKPIGSLTAYYAETHSFTPNEIEELTTFANQAALAVANARLYARTDQALARRIDQLATLQQISRDLVSSLDLDQVMQHLLERAASTTGATLGNVGIWDEEHAVTRVTVTYGYAPEEVPRVVHTVWPVSAGLVGRAIRTGRSFFVTDVQTDPDYVALNPHIRSEMVVLLRKEERILGIINLESPQIGRFDQASLDFIEQLATQAVIALENAQLYHSAQSRLREMSILYEVGQRLTSILNLPQLGRELTHFMARALNMTYCGLQVFEANTGTLQTIGRYLAPGAYTVETAQGLDDSYRLADYPALQAAINQRDLQIVYRDDPVIHPSDQALLEQLNIFAMLNLPLVLSKELIGVVMWGDERSQRRFGTSEIQFARTLANQATIAVHNARLFEDRARRIHGLSKLYQASLMLTTSVELGQALTNIGVAAREITGADSATLYLYDAVTDSFTRAYGQGKAEEPVPAEDVLHTGLTRRVIEQRQPLLVGDTQTEPEMKPWAMATGIQSLIAAPLISQNQVIGVLYVNGLTAHCFDEDEQQLVSALANQAAVAIENARLFGERERRINTLSELYQASVALSTSIDLESVLRRISTVAREISRADAASLYVYDERTDSFTRAYAIGVTGDWSPAHLRSTGMTRRVIKEGKPVLVTDTDTNPEVNPHTIEAGVGSLIAVPLISQGQPVGVMYVGSFKRQHFDEGDVQLVSALANQAAVAIANARLFSEIAESRDQLQAILDSADDGLLIFEPDSRIVMVNPRLEAMWDVPHGWLNDRRLLDLLEQSEVRIADKLGYTPEGLRPLLKHLIAANELTVTKQVFVLPGQSPAQYIERAGLPVLDAERQPIGWMIILRDVTEELELQRMRDDLTNTIIHDLRSPLSSILGSLYFLEELSESTPETPARQALTISIRSANKLMSLVNSLLDIARLSTGQALVDVRAQRLESVLDAAVEYLQPLAQDSEITVVKHLEPDLPLVLIDEDKINRVLINLLDNALKFTPRGGQVTIAVGRWTDSAALYQVRCLVRDNGPGIPPEYRTRVFDRFVQITNHPGRRRGTGIGLNFCQLAVEAHGGKIWVEEGPEGGSDFLFTLPAVVD